MANRFDNKVVIVTGGSSGIGKSAAIRFAAEGAKVVVAARREEQSKDVVDIIKENGGEATYILTDVAQEKSIKSMVNETIDTYGKLDCAFNNAGIAGDVFVPTSEHTVENWDAVINVNLKGIWLCMKYQILEMLKNGKGVILNNSSIYGLTGSTVGNAPYVASKHGVIGLTKTAAIDYAKNGLRVNALCPGYTQSEIVAEGMEEHPEVFQNFILPLIPTGKIAETDEVVNAALWLCSDESSCVTGVAFAADGGFLAR